MSLAASLPIRPPAPIVAAPAGPELLTAGEVVNYLRLDQAEGDPFERLRNLIRRAGLPCLRCGRGRLFRRADVDRWLDGRTKNGNTKRKRG